MKMCESHQRYEEEQGDLRLLQLERITRCVAVLEVNVSAVS